MSRVGHNPRAGRPSIYSDCVAEQICVRLIGGESLRSICRNDGMPSAETVRRWLADAKHTEFRVQYARARTIQGEAFGERVADLSEQVINGELEPNAARVAMDGLKWSAAKLAPKVYGEARQGHKAKAGGKVEKADLSALSDDELEALEKIMTKLERAREQKTGS